MSATRESPTLKVTLPYTALRANNTLPLVRRIVADLVDCFRRWEAAVRQVELASHDNVLENAEAERAQAETQRLAVEIDHGVRELAELGVEVRALDVGLVDFPGTLDGQDVFFCWMLGESAVTHWHARNAGFADRQLLAASS